MYRIKPSEKELDIANKELKRIKMQLLEERQSKARHIKLLKDSTASVQQELTFREESIYLLQKELINSKHLVRNLSQKLASAKIIITKQNSQISDAIRGQRMALNELKETFELQEFRTLETEFGEMHKLLEAERKFFNKDRIESQIQVTKLKKQTLSLERKLVKADKEKKEKSNEIFALEAQLAAVEDRAKQMLLQQDSEISNAAIALSEMTTKIERIECKRNVHIGDENKLEVQSQIDETGNFKTINENNQHAEEIAELKAKFLRHKDILKTNYEQAENEVIRLDEIYHDTVGMVLKAFKSAPDIINSNEELMKLKETLELALLEAQQESLSSQPIVNKHNFNSNPNGEER